MSTKFTIDLEQLDSVIARLSGLVGFVEEQLDELDRRIAELPTTWSGLSADAHADAHNEWSSGARDLRDGLDIMRAAATRAHEQYSNAVAANLRIFGRGNQR